jgi:Mg2+-importing ATPase
MNIFSEPARQTQRFAPERGANDGLLVAVSRLQPHEACAKLGSALEGLSGAEAALRLKKFGPNLVARERKATIPEELWSRARNPLNALLLALASVSYFLGDVRAAVVIAAMVVLQSQRPSSRNAGQNEAAARLRAMVHTTASVRRSPCQLDDPFSEVPMDCLVPGDVVRLSAGDMIPADLRLLEAKDLFINQSALTGESMPAEKHAQACVSDHEDVFDLPNLCFMGRMSSPDTVSALFSRPARQPSSASLPTRLPDGAFRLPSTGVSIDSPG